jgi:hypothetical protein
VMLVKTKQKDEKEMFFLEDGFAGAKINTR